MRSTSIDRRTEVRATQHRNIVIAIGFGVLCAVLSYLRFAAHERDAGAFGWSLRGVAELWQGQNPYDTPIGQAEPLLYPLPALIVAAPFALLPTAIAAALFVGVSTALLCWGVSRDGWRRWPMLFGAPLWAAVFAAQWSPLIVAAALLPTLFPLALAKPTVGLPMLLAARSPRHLLRFIAVALGTALLLPAWLWTWMGSGKEQGLFVPALGLPGVVLLLAASRWRDRATRLLLLMALMPQRALSDQLGLWLVAHSWQQALALSIGSWIAWWGWRSGSTSASGWVVAWLYGPAFAICVWRVIKPRLHVTIERVRSAQHRGRKPRFAAQPIQRRER